MHNGVNSAYTVASPRGHIAAGKSSEEPPLTSSVVETKVNRNSPDYEKNTRRLVDLVTEIKNQEIAIQQGGGAKAIEAQHKKARLTARERIAKLIDPRTPFFELGIYAAYEMYEEWGGAPAAGTVTGLGRVCGRLVMVIANDATVKAGAFFPLTAKKVIRAQNISIENHIPTIYLVDSAGVFLPLQEDVFPDTDDFGRVFRDQHWCKQRSDKKYQPKNLAARKCTLKSAAQSTFASLTTNRACNAFARSSTKWDIRSPLDLTTRNRKIPRIRRRKSTVFFPRTRLVNTTCAK